MRHLFIVNPIAGKGKALEDLNAICACVGETIDYKVEVTKYKGHATEIARRYATEGNWTIYAVGGDGTINEVVNGLVGTNTPLAIVPAGSGNDFIRTIYPHCERQNLLNNLITGTVEQVDLMKINERYFLNIASVGIDAEVVYNATAFKKLRYVKGEMAYLMSIFKTLWQHKSQRLKVWLDGKETCHQKVLLLAVANGQFYGGGIPIAPSARVNDALAHIYMVRDLKISSILPLIPKLFKARHEENKEVEVYQARQIAIESNEMFKVNIDGEIVETNVVEMEIIPHAIQVIVPAS